eukprot:Tamp_13728.p1 GENE.Tamp_13728~~Tamp_13728.p1  ORF type:complete len:551 (-),score=66.68 Tamp_13728:37-1650(-)
MPAGSTDADQRVWGSLHQTAQTFEILLNIVPGVVLARVGTAALRLTGYQVLDVPGTSALKDACVAKPEAAVLGVGTAACGDGFISKGPASELGMPQEYGRMGITAMDSISDEGKHLTIYLPFLRGSLKKPRLTSGDPERLRVSIAESPLFLLPTRLILKTRKAAENDHAVLRCQWLADPETLKAHNSAAWVMKDRYLLQRINVKTNGKPNLNWKSDAMREFFMNVLMWRLNVAQTCSGALWWQGHPETISPYTKGWVAGLSVKDWPVFSASKCRWNETAAQSISSDGASATATSSSSASSNNERPGSVDYLIVTPTFSTPGRHRQFLSTLSGGFDAMADKGMLTWLGLLYAVAVPKHLLITRVFETPMGWFSGAVKLKTPSVTPGTDRASEQLVWNRDRETREDMLCTNISFAKDFGTVIPKCTVSACVGAEQNLSLHSNLKELVWGNSRFFYALIVRFPRGVLQMALERDKQANKAAAELSINMRGNSTTKTPEVGQMRISPAQKRANRLSSTLVLGTRWEQGKRLQYGAGFNVEL